MAAARVWSPYLTKSDRDHLSRQESRRMGFGERPVLLVVDMYRWVFGDRREPLHEAIDRWPASCGEIAWDTLPVVADVIAEARSQGVPVVFTTGRSDLFGQSPKTIRSGTAAPAHADRYEIMPDVTPESGEVVLAKAAPSAFFGTALASYLTHVRADTVVVVGESTSGCVRATVVDAFSHRYRVGVVEEAVFDRHQASHAMNLFDMDQKYADVVTKAEIVTYFRSFAHVDAPATT